MSKNYEKVITEEDYAALPGGGAVALLNGLGNDGELILKHSKGAFKDGRRSITTHYLDEKGGAWRRSVEFIPNEKY